MLPLYLLHKGKCQKDDYCVHKENNPAGPADGLLVHFNLMHKQMLFLSGEVDSHFAKVDSHMPFA